MMLRDESGHIVKRGLHQAAHHTVRMRLAPTIVVAVTVLLWQDLCVKPPQVQRCFLFAGTVQNDITLLLDWPA